jgi:tRNA dimethylallyltransferase
MAMPMTSPASNPPIIDWQHCTSVGTNRTRHLALVGPTATGKSAIALDVAARAGLEIVTVDSMQVYRGMDIGTAKPTSADRAAVAHHLLDVVDPDEEYTVARWQRDARAVLDDLEARGGRALLVGGTGLYLRALVDDLEIPGRWPEIRAALEAEVATVGAAALHDRLADLDPLAAGRMQPGNTRRVVRALEVTMGSGRPFSSFGPGLEAHGETSVDQIALDVEPAELAERIEARYVAQLEAGFLDEVAALAARPAGLSRTAAQALGYKELLAHLRGEAGLEESLDLAVRRTRQFARKQRAWFRRDPRITWVRPEAAGNLLFERLGDPAD